MARDINPFGLRIPQDLKEALETAASKNKRSLNSEMVVRLEQSIVDDQSSAPLDAQDPLSNILRSLKGITKLENSIRTSVNQIKKTKR